MRKLPQLAAAMAAVVLIAGCNVMRGNQEAGDYVDDATLTARVKAALVQDETVSGTQFNVDVYQGRVTLSGTTQSEAERAKAAEVARNVEGVKSVNNSIRVATGGDSSTQSNQQNQSGTTSTQ